MKIIAILIALSFVEIGFAADSETDRLKPALDAITADGLLAHIKILASDEFERDLQKNLEVLNKAGATNVTGFRAPFFSLTERGAASV